MSNTEAVISRNSEVIYEIYESFDGLEALRDPWDNLAIETKCPIYLSFDWVKLWWQFYGNSKRLRIYVCRDSERLLGVVPLEIEVIGRGPISFRVARIVGANVPPRTFRLPIDDRVVDQVYRKVLENLFDIEGCDLLSIGHVDHAFVEQLKSAFANGMNQINQPEFVAKDVSTTFHLPETFDDFLASLKSKERKIRRKKLRDLESERSVRVEVIQDRERAVAEFEAFAAQHTEQWKSEGRPGHFGAWPDALEFNRAMVAAQAKHGRVRFVKLMADEHVVANQYTFAFGDGIYALLPARATGEQWDRFGLGATSQIKLLETSIDDGFKRLESGLGHYDYKVALNGEEKEVGVVRILRRGALSKIKLAAYTAWGRFMTLLLHKLWYRRVAPRLGKGGVVGRPSVLLRFDF